MYWILLLIMFLLICFCVWLTMCKEKWQYSNWDFDDMPAMCKRKLQRANEAMEFANTPHFGGTPNNSQVWM